MKKGYVILLIILAIIIILTFVLNLFGFLGFLNDPISYIIAGKPSIRCNVDSDCELRFASCGSCSKCDVFNYYKWHPYCPFKRYEQECPTQPSCFLQGSLKCIDNMCKKISS